MQGHAWDVNLPYHVINVMEYHVYMHSCTYSCINSIELNILEGQIWISNHLAHKINLKR